MWDLVSKIFTFINFFLDKVIRGRSEKAMDEYRITAKDILDRQQKRWEARRDAEVQAKEVLNAVDNDGCDDSGCK